MSEVVKLVHPWRAKAALLRFCIDMLDEACEGAVRFIQIGAHDGVLADPVSAHLGRGDWRGVMVEPHPVYFADLKRHVGESPGIDLVNCAVSDKEGEMTLWHVAETSLHKFRKWARGCATFSRDRLIEALDGKNLEATSLDFDTDIVGVAVPTRPLSSILGQTDLREADLLLIDVEGWELPVLRSFDCAALNFRLAIIECNGPERASQAEVSRIMSDAGFEVFRLRDDLIAIHPERLKIPLSRVMDLLNQDRLNTETESMTQGQANAYS